MINNAVQSLLRDVGFLTCMSSKIQEIMSLCATSHKDHGQETTLFCLN